MLKSADRFEAATHKKLSLKIYYVGEEAADVVDYFKKHSTSPGKPYPYDIEVVAGPNNLADSSNGIFTVIDGIAKLNTRNSKADFTEPCDPDLFKPADWKTVLAFSGNDFKIWSSKEILVRLSKSDPISALIKLIDFDSDPASEGTLDQLVILAIQALAKDGKKASAALPALYRKQRSCKNPEVFTAISTAISLIKKP